ncbi:hypothetical protein MGH68_03560 [Erysipelothrix sp. D19-032]
METWVFRHWALPGGALGTLIARIVELAFIGYFLATGSYAFKTRIRELFQISKTLVKRIVEKALPLALNEVLWASGMALLLKFYATRGADVISRIFNCNHRF